MQAKFIVSFLLLIPFVYAGDNSFREAAILVQKRLKAKQLQQRRFLKSTVNVRRDDTIDSVLADACTDSGLDSASCCTPSDANVCCDGDSGGSLICKVSTLKFDMKDCHGTSCTECHVSGVEDGESVDCGSCNTCSDGSVAYECVGFAYSC